MFSRFILLWYSEGFIKICFYLYVTYVHIHVRLKRILDPLELALLVVMSCLVCVLQIELGSSVRAASALTTEQPLRLLTYGVFRMA